MYNKLKLCGTNQLSYSKTKYQIPLETRLNIFFKYFRACFKICVPTCTLFLSHTNKKGYYVIVHTFHNVILHICDLER